MNKIFKSLLILTAGIFTVACDLDQVNELYVPENDEPNMLYSIYNDLELEASLQSLSIPVTRAKSDGEFTVDLAVVLPEGITTSGTAGEADENGNTTYKSSVTFAAGESIANVVLDISAMEVGNQYAGSVSFADSTQVNVNTATFTCNFKLAKAYTWTSLGEGEWFDQLALKSSDSYGIQKVEVLKAEGFERYRIMNPYANTDQLTAAWGAECVGGMKDSYIEFWVLEDGVHVAWDGWWYPGLLYSGEGTDIKAYYPSALSSSLATDDAKSMFLDEKVVGFYPYWYIDGLGGFGAKYLCALALPEGPDLETWLNG